MKPDNMQTKHCCIADVIKEAKKVLNDGKDN